MACVLCLEDASSKKSLGLFSEEGMRLNISNIISKHFWLRPNSELCPEQLSICFPCWDVVQNFHQLYKRVERAHNYFETKEIVIETIDDPLPQETNLQKFLKSAETNCTEPLLEPATPNFFDSEVKVEVHDLDLLPQIEIIENIHNLSDRAQRAYRRNCMANENATTIKKIKREPSPPGNTLSNDSEFPLSKLLEVDFKTDSPGQSIETNHDVTDVRCPAIAEPQKRRRGRPKKCKEENATASISTELLSTDLVAPKTEQIDGDSFNGGQENLAIDGTSGTDDTAETSSESSDSDESLPDIEPEERYAEIPKRVVVKPKKYRKRPKPLVPPRRMTREEIEQKNAQQLEYDKVIAKFFEKFTCCKCGLLVQNFGDMKKHFRASHNEDPGYMMCCGRKFYLRKALAEHVYLHWNPEHFKCGTCSKIFNDSRTLEIHEQAHIKPPEVKDKKVFQCDKCPKFFTTKAAFEYHSFSKHVPKSEFKFTCTECNKKLPTQRKLKDHIKYMHDPESAIICDKCGKKMRSQSNLKKHHQIEHSDIPRPVPVPMQCEICGTWLRHLSGLKQHMKSIHEDPGGEHRCPICNKISTNARALKRHIYHNHECDRKFKCTMCEKAFKRRQDLREHTSTHTGEVLYTCPNCPMTFFSNANMYKHRQRLHRAEWEADRKKPVPPNIMRQATGATAAMKMKQAVGAASAFFAHKTGKQSIVLPQSESISLLDS